MKIIYKIIATTFLSVYCTVAIAQQPVFTAVDSIRVIKALEHAVNCDERDNVSEAAMIFIGCPYVASTLDSCNTERVVINTREFDCTTFVETVAAIAITAKNNKIDFAEFCHTLQQLRYRNGVCNGYTSRLHYISQWIADSCKKGIIEEVITDLHTAVQQLNLNFMSTHPSSYRQLKDNNKLIAEIERYEKPFRNISIKYIPKNRLNGTYTLSGIKDGDILALVTSIKGLDVTHVGFAHWIDSKLHLIHASSAKGATIIDEQTLYDYMRTKESSLGVRVFRIKDN